MPARRVTTILPESESGLGDDLRRSLGDATSAIQEGRDKITSLRAGVRKAPGAGTPWRIEIKAALAYADGRRRTRWFGLPAKFNRALRGRHRMPQ